ncbi:hypothetical protein GGX14DRAFT_384895 [Mycena pura]|uniref:Uncharacterized protein n=1 Tax=Mycena pura TaxID=153505 RepID=A0AAD7E568_9AGAR|nr:hypothetical protein GGX14DRAFT_384895 [Mycena pura]
MDFRDQLNPQNFYGQPSPRPSGSRLPPRTPATPAVTAPLSSMPRMRAPRRRQWEKMHDILGHISHDLDGLGNFLELLFYIRPHGTKDVRTPRHKAMVTAFLGGQTKVKMGHIIDLIYHHRQSQPPPGSEERDLAFSHNVPHTTISFARPRILDFTMRWMIACPRGVVQRSPRDGAMKERRVWKAREGSASTKGKKSLEEPYSEPK